MNMEDHFVKEGDLHYEISNRDGMLYVIIDDNDSFSWNFRHKIMVKVVLSSPETSSLEHGHSMPSLSRPINRLWKTEREEADVMDTRIKVEPCENLSDTALSEENQLESSLSAVEVDAGNAFRGNDENCKKRGSEENTDTKTESAVFKVAQKNAGANGKCDKIKRRKGSSVAKDSDCVVSDSQNRKITKGSCSSKDQLKRRRSNNSETNVSGCVTPVSPSRRVTMSSSNNRKEQVKKKKTTATSVDHQVKACEQGGNNTAANSGNSSSLLSYNHNDTNISESETEVRKETFCKYCNRTFASGREFQVHMFNRSVDKRRLYRCDTCKRKFRFKATLLVHNFANHSTTREESHPGELSGAVADKSQSELQSVNCFICRKPIKDLKGLETHMKTHTDEHHYMCCVCDKRSMTLNSLRRHLERTHVGDVAFETTFTCLTCKAGFPSRQALQRHRTAVHKSNCNFCGQNFTNSAKRAVHLASCHQDEAPQCSQCQQYCNTEADLQKHLRYHRFHHKKQCTICGDFVIRLQTHMIKHGGKHVVCDQCPAAFNTQASLKRHQRIHTGEKPFKCDLCDQYFRCESTRRKHRRTHTKERPYICGICGKQCAQNYNLKVHMRIHSESKAFICSICGQGFNYNASLKGHIKSKHGQVVTGKEGQKDLEVTNFQTI